MIGNLGMGELVLILIIALVIFGPKKLPDIGRAVGKTIQEFKKAGSEVVTSVQEDPEPKKIEKPIEATIVETKTETLEKTETTEEKK